MKKTFDLLIIFISGFLASCYEDDQSESNEKHESLENLHNFKKNNISFQQMKKFIYNYGEGSVPELINTSLNKNGNSYITKIDSTSITQITHDNVTTFTLPVYTLDDEIYTFSNLIIKLYNGKYEEFVLHYNPTTEWQIAYANGDNFPYDGELVITNTDGEILSLNDDESIQGKSSICYMDIYIPCYGSSCPCTDGNGQNYTLVTSCGSVGGGSSSGNGSGSSGSGSSGGNSGSGNNGGSGPAPGQGIPDPGNGIPTAPTPNEFLSWLEYVYDGELQNNPCTKAVYNKLKNTKTMFNVIKNFMGSKPVAHLEWKIDHLGANAGETGVKSSTNNELIQITIDQSYTEQASPISMARTMLHEALHAEVFRKLISVGGWPINTNVESEFPGIWDYWIRYKNNLTQGEAISSTLHNHMASHYRSKIKEGLIEFDKKYGTTHEDWQYEALSWGGLYGTTAWNNLPSNTRTAYYNYIQQQQNAGGCP